MSLPSSLCASLTAESGRGFLDRKSACSMELLCLCTISKLYACKNAHHRWTRGVRSVLDLDAFKELQSV